MRGHLSSRRDERGAIAIITAISMLLIMVAVGMALDFGLVRADRQADKSAADAATLAGLQGLGQGDGSAHPYSGVCAAIRYLQKNGNRFGSLSDVAGSWTNGDGVPQSNGCTTAALTQAVCQDGVSSSWARFVWNGTWQGTALQVTIQSGYSLPDASFVEDTLSSATMTANQDDGHQGCDQLAVIVKQNRKPGFGSLATSSQLISTVRTVGRVTTPPGGYAPAMLLLKRTGCPVLETGSNSGGSHIYVFGAASSNGLTQPGTIHADSDGSNCTGGSNQSVFLGKAGSGIVAFAAPLLNGAGQPTSSPDLSKPGLISSLAARLGTAATVIRDSLANVYGSAAINPAGAPAAGKNEVVGRGLVTRKPVDDRYMSGVKNIIASAQGTVFSTLTAANAVANGYVLLSNCNPNNNAINALNLVATSKLFVDCTANNGFNGPATLNAGTVVFNGKVNPQGAVSLPNATKVYVFGAAGGDALNIGQNATFSMHSSGNMNGSLCSNSQNSDKAILVIRAGDVKETGGGTLRLCYTTMITMGGQANGCVPTVTGTPPTATPCLAGTGDGQLSQTGGDVDWTAPNQNDVMTLSDGTIDPTKAPAWSDPNGPEDLAYWSESYGGSSNPTYNMNGGGTLHIVGVYMVPNADPFTIGGGASQTLTNAQYIATSIALNGTNTSISMVVDPNSAVPLGSLKSIGLVR
jgi:Flp pilus assembly protein TadG